MRIGAIAIAMLAAAASQASAQDESAKADPRAVEACRRESATFVQVADCLPEAHVAVITLDAFSEIYPPEADDLKSRCLTLNETISGARACVTEAVKAAVGLKDAGANLSDPLFQALSSREDWEKLQEIQSDAQSDFPEKRFWGMTMYKPYR